jgi:hypothetical protein
MSDLYCITFTSRGDTAPLLDGFDLTYATAYIFAQSLKEAVDCIHYTLLSRGLSHLYLNSICLSHMYTDDDARVKRAKRHAIDNEGVIVYVGVFE